MNDAMDGAMDNANDVDESEKIYTQICDEIGVDLAEEHDVKNGKINVGQPSAAVSLLSVSK